MGIVQLDPPIYLDTPLGSAICLFVWERGLELDVQWCCFIEATGEPWWFPNNKVRLWPNLSAGRATTSPIKPMAGLAPHVKRHRASAPGRKVPSTGGPGNTNSGAGLPDRRHRGRNSNPEVTDAS